MASKKSFSFPAAPVFFQPLIGISPRPKLIPQSAGQIRDFKDLDIELMKEKERNRELQQKLHRAESELDSLQRDGQMKHFNDGLAGDSADPSAPPPPYLASGSPCDSVTSSDNNLDAPSDDDDDEDGYNHHVVTVDVHHGTPLRRSVLHRRQEFSFTDSILEEIESDASPNKPKTHYTK